jgi:FKBP-type peptidyl-prolyl cis-trans isomerase
MRITTQQAFKCGLLALPTLAVAAALAAPAPSPGVVAPPVAVGGHAAAEAAAEDAASYSLGLTFGGQLHNGGLKEGLAMDALMRGISDGMRGKTVTQDDKQRAAVLLRSGKEAISARNKSAARDFLAKNAKEDGVTTTPSGLQYKVLEAGKPGPSPTPTDQVTVQYRGRLLNGAEFDSSYSRGQAAIFRVNAVIKGWQEALTLMKPGAKWQLFVPPELAYDVNSPASIPPGSLLVFDIELVKVNAPTTLNDPGMHQSPKTPPKS